jgi:hypothetical protein
LRYQQVLDFLPDQIKTLIYQQRSKEMANHRKNGRKGRNGRKNLASETQNLGHWTLKKGYMIGYGYDILKSLKIGYHILKISCSKKG